MNSCSNPPGGASSSTSQSNARLVELEENFLDLENIFDLEINNESDTPLFDKSKFPRSRYEEVCNLSTGRSDSQLTVLQLNCQGLCSSFADLTTLCQQLQPDVVGLCETFLTRQTDTLLEIPGYTSHFLHRTALKRGGLAIYTRQEYSVCINKELTRNIEGIYESLFLEICLPSQKKLTVGEVYRPPAGSVSSFLENLSQISDHLEKQGNEAILMGDFNINLTLPLSSGATDLLSIMSASNMYPSTTIPTRVTATSHSLIDNIFSTLPPTSASVLLSDTSDHFPLLTNFNIQHKYPKPNASIKQGFTTWKLNDENLKTLNQNLESTSWESVMNTDDVNSGFEEFHNIFMRIYTDCCCEKRSRKTGRKNQPISPWISHGLLQCINRKNKLWMDYTNDPCIATLEKYEKYKKCLRSVLRKAKRDYFSGKIAESGKNSRKIWKVVNSILRPCSPPPELPSKLSVNGETVTGPDNVANALGTFFAEVGRKTADSVGNSAKSFKDYLGPACTKSMAIAPVSPSEILLIVLNLRGNSASGFDRVHTKVLKAVAPSIIEPLTYLINLSLHKGTFPELLKKARIIPLHKGGSRVDPANYRPISILSVFSKVFEKPMQQQLLQFLEKKGFLNNRQFGFRPGHSTQDALTALSLWINKALDSGLLPAAVLLDIRKAFDSMYHSILLGKLEHIGIRGEALDWFRSYLRDRRIYLGEDPGNDVLVNCGVPQGSILGPLLFLIHVNDLSRVLNPARTNLRCCNLCQDENSLRSEGEDDELVAFADDTTLGCCETDKTTLMSKLREVLEGTYLWMDANRLVINVEKSCVLFFSRVGSVHPEICGIQTSRGVISRPEKHFAKYLGILLDENLSFVHHIQAVELKLSRNFGIIKKLKSALPQKTLVLLYNALIKPHLQYCAMIWQSTFKSHLRKLNSIHQRCLILIGKNEEYLSLGSLHQLSCLTFVFKFLAGELPSAFKRLFRPISDQHNLHTRSSSNLQIPLTPTVRSDFAPNVACAKIWNLIPEELRGRSSLASFKKRVKNHLIALQMNS